CGSTDRRRAADQPACGVPPPSPAQGRGDGGGACGRHATDLPPRGRGTRGRSGVLGDRMRRSRDSVSHGCRDHAEARAMSETRRVSFDVACSVGHAFETWIERIGTWWPRDHTISGAPSAIVIEGQINGRIYERTQYGEEHEWGVVTAW